MSYIYTSSDLYQRAVCVNYDPQWSVVVVWAGVSMSLVIMTLRLWWFIPGGHQFWPLSSLGFNCIL